MSDALLNYDLMYGFLVAVGIGVLVGIERERNQAKQKEFRVAGVRTFTLIAMLGATASLLAQYSPALSFAIVAGFVLLVTVGYYVSSMQSRLVGQTTEVAEILVFALSYLSLIPEMRNMSVMLAIIVTTLLALKEHLHGFAREIKEYELMDTLKFAVITFIVLPLLPDYAIDSWGIINPRQIWLFVIFISGISYLGYILVKILGTDRGSAVTGLLGGLSSSTAVTLSMAKRAKDNTDLIRVSVFAAVIASTVMFPRVVFETSVINNSLAGKLIVPAGLMFFSGIAASIIILKSQEVKDGAKIELRTPLALGPAVKFGAFFLLILVFQHLAQKYLGSNGVYAVSLFSGLADVDAITLTTSKMAAEGYMQETVAMNAIIIAAISNTLMKTFYAYVVGGRRFGKLYAAAATAMAAAGALSIMLIR